MSELEDLKVKCKNQARQLTIMQDSLARKNRELDALHMVWCSGGCPNGVHRFTDEPISQETVEFIERNAKRLRTWWNAAIFRIDKPPTGDEWYDKRIERIRKKVER